MRDVRTHCLSHARKALSHRVSLPVQEMVPMLWQSTPSHLPLRATLHHLGHLSCVWGQSCHTNTEAVAGKMFSNPVRPRLYKSLEEAHCTDMSIMTVALSAGVVSLDPLVTQPSYHRMEPISAALTGHPPGRALGQQWLKRPRLCSQSALIHLVHIQISSSSLWC